MVLDKKHVDAKCNAVAEYKSQGFRKYADKDFLYSLARTRGMQINVDYAEAFELIRWIL